MSQKAVPNFVI